MTTLRTLALATLGLLVATAPGAARIHAQMYCWIDLEFPVPCEASDDEEEAAVVPFAPPPSVSVLTHSIATQAVLVPNSWPFACLFR